MSLTGALSSSESAGELPKDVDDAGCSTTGAFSPSGVWLLLRTAELEKDRVMFRKEGTANEAALVIRSLKDSSRESILAGGVSLIAEVSVMATSGRFGVIWLRVERYYEIHLSSVES